MEESEGTLNRHQEVREEFWLYSASSALRFNTTRTIR